MTGSGYADSSVDTVVSEQVKANEHQRNLEMLLDDSRSPCCKAETDIAIANDKHGIQSKEYSKVCFYF